MISRVPQASPAEIMVSKTPGFPIANAIADAYIVDQLEAKYQATRRASVWLQDRIKELRQQASEADRAVLDYKEKNNIISLGGGNAATGSTTGKLLGEQQLEELNTQLGAARAAAEEVKARLDRINEVMSKDVPDATVADSLHNEVINRLRNNYLDLSAKEAIWSARYGSSHLAAVNLRTQMAELRRSILDELGRIQQGYKSDYEIAKTRVEGLERSLEGLVANSQVVNRDRLGLRDLESTNDLDAGIEAEIPTLAFPEPILTWTAGTANGTYFEGQTPVSCITDTGLNVAADKTAAVNHVKCAP